MPSSDSIIAVTVPSAGGIYTGCRLKPVTKAVRANIPDSFDVYDMEFLTSEDTLALTLTLLRLFDKDCQAVFLSHNTLFAFGGKCVVAAWQSYSLVEVLL